MAKRKVNKVGIGCCIACLALGFGSGMILTENLDSAEKNIQNIKFIDVPLSEAMQTHITELCNENGIPVALAYAVIDHESSFNADVVSDTADYGLMQVNVIMKQEVGENVDLLNPYSNTKVGIELLGKYWKEFDGNVNDIAMAYNMGVVGMRKTKQKGYDETDYSKTVVNKYKRYKEILENDK